MRSRIIFADAHLLMTHFIGQSLNTIRRRASLCACALACVAYGLFASAQRTIAFPNNSVTHLSSASSFSDRSSVVAHPVPGSTFRLGDAARPFGWATAVGDFDRDGAPDVAVADHIGRRAGLYAYRIEFSLSGDAENDVVFESTDDAVTIRSLDVDHDNDLDIVVGRPLSGGAVAVWLNDGHGHFTSGDVRQLPATIEGLAALDASGARGDVATFAWSSSRTDVAVSVVYVASRDSGDRIVGSHTRALFSPFAFLPACPRAPPQHSVDA